ncbi:MAG TPA: MOSC domain-containing protein [Gemmataceae bacterium]|nr:MOSC domain-containing protein [Gemmataceae bacterium]
MFEGSLLAIYIGDRKREALQRVDTVQAVPGKGLAGDRYFLQQGTFTKPGSPDREVTLIEMEAIDALAKECQITLDPGQARRNLVTRGVPLNHLVGRPFRIGEVVLRGLRLCEPCDHLESLTVKGILDGLRHRGGLRAQIVEGGLVRAGDAIRPLQAQA